MNEIVRRIDIMACGKLMQLEDEREHAHDADIQQCIDDIHYIRETTTCIIHQLHERIEDLEINNAYLMDWRVKHDNEVARKKKRK